MSSKQPLILVSGFGSIGRRHLTNLIALRKSDTFVHSTGLGVIPKEGLGDVRVLKNLDEALACRPDAIVVANPTSLHLDVALRAVQAGCHLFVEKPISNKIEGVDVLAKELDARKLACVVGFQYRFHPTLQKVKGWIDQGVIGRVVSAQAHWGEYLPDWHSWEDYRVSYSARNDLGGGVILTLCHPFDYLCWILGEVESVFAVGGHVSKLDLDVEDTVQVTLRFKSGVVGGVHLDYVQRPPRHTLSLVGQDGTIEWDGHSGIARVYDASHRTWDEAAPPPGFERNTMFLEEMTHFLNCIQGKEQPICTLEDGERALKIALAAKRSIVDGLPVSEC